MKKKIIIKKKIKSFKKKIFVNSDKSISIRWVLLASLANGVSEAKNLLLSEDVKAALQAIKKLGIKTVINKNTFKIYGQGIEGYNYKKNIEINAQNSGTLGRILLGWLVNTKAPIKIIGDKSLSKRDFLRIAKPLNEFGPIIKLNKNKNLPLTIHGSESLRPIKYFEKRGSAQCKTSVIFAGFRTQGKTIIRAKKSRNHTELLCKYLRMPIKIKSNKHNDLIEVNRVKKIKSFNYTIPNDISSAAFFMVLTALTKDSILIIKNVNINPTRTGIVEILKKMGVKIFYLNKKLYKGEKVSDIKIISPTKLKPINCSPKLNSKSIDEFLVIFLAAAKAKGISYFKNLQELNQKESPRLEWGNKILKMIGIKTIKSKNSIKIFGNPEIKIKKKIVIRNFLKDHRVFMTSTIAALSFGGEWHIYNPDSIKTSFPSFLKILKQIKK